jgi:DNA-binding MarR family transcriptional regulator
VQAPVVHPLSAAELAAWRGLLRVHARLVRELDRELREAHALPLREYEVLLVLESAPGRALRMSELADLVLLSHSGLTRLADRLERAGYVERGPCATDRRGLLARLTDKGAERLREARPTHLAGVREWFLSHLSGADLEYLAGAWERVDPGASA